MLPSRPVRRCLLPLDALVLVALALVCLVVALIGAVLAPFTSRRRILRLAAWALSYCLVELASLAAAGLLWVRRVVPGRLGLRADAEWRAANQALLAWALGRVLAAGRRWLGFHVVVADTSDATALGRDEPVLVLARHGGPGDSFALAHLLLTRYHRRVRIVLKDVLQFDPLIDLLLNRLGSCFLGPSRGAREDPTGRLGALAGDLGPGDALLLFPEGANWTPLRRTRAIGRLRRERKPDAARVATLMTNVLPPRPAGVFACVDAHSGLDVVVVAHAGLDRLVGVRDVWERLPLRTPMTVRAWPTAPVPPGEDERLAWLTLEWAVVDEWVDAFHAGVITR